MLLYLAETGDFTRRDLCIEQERHWISETRGLFDVANYMHCTTLLLNFPPKTSHFKTFYQSLSKQIRVCSHAGDAAPGSLPLFCLLYTQQIQMDKLLLYFKQTLAVPRDDDDDEELCRLLYFLFPPLWGWFWSKCFTYWVTFIFLQSQVFGDLDKQNTRRWERNCPMCNAGVRTAWILCGTDSTMCFLRDFCLYWNDSLTQLLLIYWLHVHDVNIPFQHIPKGAL